jgi:hypothetical protein
VSQGITDALNPYLGQWVLLDRTITQCDGFFDRFGIKQKFANPEEAYLRINAEWMNPKPGRQTGRPAFGSNIAFKEDIPLLPSFPLVFGDERSQPWLTMSEGVLLYDPEAAVSLRAPFSESISKGCWNYAGKVKFYMQVREKPAGDMTFALTASPRVSNGAIVKQKMAVYANNRLLGEWLWDRPEPAEKTIVIPRAMLEESADDEMRLLTLMFYLSDPDAPNASPMFSLMFEKMEFRKVNEP